MLRALFGLGLCFVGAHQWRLLVHPLRPFVPRNVELDHIRHCARCRAVEVFRA